MRRPRSETRIAIRVTVATAVALAPLSAAAQSTAGFPPVTAPAPAPTPAPAPAPYTPPAPAPYTPPAPYVAPRAPGPYPQSPPQPGYQPYPPAGYQQPYPMPPGYRPPAPYTPPAPVTPGYVAPGYVAPAYPQGPPPPPPPRDPLMDENLRYRQQLGAYRRGAAPPPPGPPARAAYVRIAPRTRHYHDGFYFRFALGIGAGHQSSKADRSLPSMIVDFAPEPYEVSGGAMTPVTELAVGYAPWPGIVIGLGVYTATIPSHTVASNDPRTGDYDVRLSQLAMFGPLLDYYPSAEGGFHIQGSPGVGTYVAGAGSATIEGPLAQAHSSVGFGFMLGVGYEWWVADQWSVGLLGRFVFASTSGSDNRNVNWEHTAYAPSVLVGLTFQ